MPDRNHMNARKPRYERRVNRYEPRQRYLIVCEGEKTEPNYFRKFPIQPTSVVEVKGVGDNTVNLVHEALRLSKLQKYDQIWCVFDRDSFPVENFNDAVQLARENGIQVAYSNESFELWYILHFDYLDTGIHRKDYMKRLDHLLGTRYQKNSENIYDLLYSRQKIAIRNSRNLLAQYNLPDPARNNPSTTVHLLVEQLNRLFWEES